MSNNTVTVDLDKGRATLAWSWLDPTESDPIQSAIADWLAQQGYQGGHLPLDWWANENLGQDCWVLEGAGYGMPGSQLAPKATIEDGLVIAVSGTLLARMYDGHYKSYFSNKRHGHPVDVRTTDGRKVVPVSWIAIPAKEILRTGSSDHGIGETP